MINNIAGMEVPEPKVGKNQILIKAINLHQGVRELGLPWFKVQRNFSKGFSGKKFLNQAIMAKSL